MGDDVKQTVLQLDTRRNKATARSAHELAYDELGHDELSLIRVAVERISDAFMITSAECAPLGPAIVYVNPAFTCMTGYVADEVIGRTPRLLTGPATNRRVLDRFDASFTTGTSFHGAAISYRKDGTTFDADWQMDPIRDAADKVSHWVAVLRDVTEQRSLEWIVHDQQTELHRTAILRMLAQFAEDTIHQSLQPLYAIGNLGAACRNAILNQHLETESGRILEWLEAILAGVNDAKLSATRLRSIAKRSAPRQETLALNDIIEPILDTLADFERSRVSFHVQLECESAVNADCAQIRYVLANLVQNATEAIQNSAAQAGNITLRSWSQDGLCYVAVEDDGPGCPYEFVADIFKPFSSEKADRLGLGLAFSRAIVEAHGGDILAERIESGGLRVEFTIPVEPAINDD